MMETITHYSGQVLANLQGPGGFMRCDFRLMSPSSGMAGGGVGQCQLPVGNDHQRAVPARTIEPPDGPADCGPRPMSWHMRVMATQLKSVQPTPDPLDDMSLPGWLYFDPEFFEAEKKAFLRAAPQVVCHESEIAEPGEWRTLEYLGESVIVIRGDDGEVRAFSNVCRHRGSRLVDGSGGCAKVLTCPYHAWSYAPRRTARRRSAPQ